MNSEHRLRWFLRYGYFPDSADHRFQLELSSISRESWRGIEAHELCQLAAERFRQAVHLVFDVSDDNLLPLSGGLDSRAILGALLECTDAQRLRTYTYGVPGTFDYEYGNRIAAYFGTNHTTVNLGVERYCNENMIRAAGRTNRQVVLFHHSPVEILDSISAGAIVWSGFVGDAICGGHMPADALEPAGAAQRRYLGHRRFVTSCDISGLDDDSATEALAPPRVSSEILSFHEQLLYDERVAKMISPQIMWRGYVYRTPFINNPFMELMLGMEDKYRREQALYRMMLMTEFPELAAFPTTAAYGLRLQSGPAARLTRRLTSRVLKALNRFTPKARIPHLNYLDFAWAIRERDDLRSLIERCICDLRDRGIVPWVDINRIWQRHQSRRANHADALLVLASLELILKAGES